MKIRQVFIILLLVVGCSVPEGYHRQEPMPANFKTINSSIFEARCVECHGPAKAAKKIDLSSYEKIMSTKLFPPLIVPGNPERSSLYESVARTDEFYMPKDRPRLNKRELQAIYDWIKNGAKKEEIPGPKKPDETTEPGGDEPGEPGGSDEPGGNSEPGSSDEPGSNEPGTP